MASIGQKIKQLAGLIGTSDVNAWGQGFLVKMVQTTKEGEDTTRLTSKQVEVIERMYAEHFA